MDCKHTKTDVDPNTSAIICIDCGVVLSEQQFETYQYASKDISVNLPAYLGDTLRHRDRFWSIYSLIHSLCDQFSLGDPVWLQGCELIEIIYDKKNTFVDKGRKGRMAAAAVLLLINRRNSNPAALNLSLLAEAIGETRISFGSYILRLKKELPEFVEGDHDNSVFIENSYTNYFKPILTGKKLLTNETDMAVVELSKDIMAIGNAAWLDVGRKADPFVAACIGLVVESHMGTKAKLFTKSVKSQICESIGITYRTFLTRTDELKRFLVKESQGLVPWPIDEKNIVANLSEVIKILLVTLEETNLVEPPSFIKGNERDQKRRQEVSTAKLRLQALMDNTPILGSTEAQLMIEKLLLLGAPEEDIVTCRDNKQLLKLVGLYETCQITSSDEE